MRKIACRIARALISFGCAFAVGHAMAQGYPTKPVRLIVGMSPGGANDTVARLVASELSKSWPQPMVVDNKPGANSTIATGELKRSAPDGYTLMLVISSHVTNTMLYPKLPYKLTDFSPVSLIADTPFVLVANPKFSPNNVRELVAQAKGKNEAIDFATPGPGSSQHIAMELLNQTAGIKMNAVPYKGGAPAQTDVLAGQIPLIFSTPAQSLPFIKQQKLKALGVTSNKRVSLLPDVPTLAESGVPGYEASVWFGIIAPAGTPPRVIAQVHKDISGVLSTPEVRTRLVDLGLNPLNGSPAQLQQIIDADMDKWTTVIRKSQIKLD